MSTWTVFPVVAGREIDLEGSEYDVAICSGWLTTARLAGLIADPFIDPDQS